MKRVILLACAGVLAAEGVLSLSAVVGVLDGDVLDPFREVADESVVCLLHDLVQLRSLLGGECAVGDESLDAVGDRRAPAVFVGSLENLHDAFSRRRAPHERAAGENLCTEEYDDQAERDVAADHENLLGIFHSDFPFC